MAGIFTKTALLLSQGRLGELLDKIRAYLRFMAVSVWFRLTFREQDPELKKTNKNWVIFTYLKSKYARLVRDYPAPRGARGTSGKIWWCWLQGEENAPPVAKACLASVRRHLSDREIVVITERNMADYADFPVFIKEKYRRGIISRTLFSDLLRLELLTRHGGTWIDSTVFLTGSPGYALDRELFAFKTRERNDPATCAQSWFMSARRNDPILSLTRDLLYEYLRKSGFVIHYFIFYFFMTMASEKYADEWKRVPFFSDVPPHILQRELSDTFSEERLTQIRRMSDVHKLSYKLPESSSGNEETFLRHILNEK